MDRDHYGAFVDITNKTHRMNLKIIEGVKDLETIAFFAYGNCTPISLAKVRRHIKWLFGLSKSDGLTVRDRMRNAGFSPIVIEERIKSVKQQFYNIDL